MVKRLLFIFVVFYLIGVLFITHHLSVNSVYYASNMPHGKENQPELVFILKNLELIKKPNFSYLSYDYDGANTIRTADDVFLSTDDDFPVITLYESDSDYHDTHHSFYFTEQGRFYYEQYYYMHKSFETRNYSADSEKRASEYLRQIIQPIIEVQEKPNINLQWLFNLIYQRHF